ncbi:hypothetical protein [[Eubacterium] cellulosolvens]
MRLTTDATKQLDLCRNFGDVFEVVKKTVEHSLGQRRSGLMLYLAELPEHVGAYHAVGTNGIVMNRTALDAVTSSARTLREINSYVYSILLHEYLHSLGYVDEAQARRLVFQISRENLGEDHPATEIAHRGPAAMFPGLGEPTLKGRSENVEIVTDFERSTDSYIK